MIEQAVRDITTEARRQAAEGALDERTKFLAVDAQQRFIDYLTDLLEKDNLLEGAYVPASPDAVADRIEEVLHG